MRLFVLLLGIIISGCASDPTVGYSTQSLYAPQFRTVAVPMFENNTTSRQMEMMLTDALVKKIQSRTPYRVVDEMNADTLLTGTITDVELQPLNRSSVTGFDNEVLLRVTVNFEWMNSLIKWNRHSFTIIQMRGINSLNHFINIFHII